jgi:hypothetical protein
LKINEIHLDEFKRARHEMNENVRIKANQIKAVHLVVNHIFIIFISV